MRKCDKKSAPSIGFETSATTNTQINGLRNDELLNVKCVCPCTASERPSAAFKQTREDANKQFNNLANDKGINDIEAPVSIKKSMVKLAMRKAANSCRALPDAAVAGAPRCLPTVLVSCLGSLQGRITWLGYLAGGFVWPLTPMSARTCFGPIKYVASVYLRALVGGIRHQSQRTWVRWTRIVGRKTVRVYRMPFGANWRCWLGDL